MRSGSYRMHIAWASPSVRRATQEENRRFGNCTIESGYVSCFEIKETET